MKTGNLIFGVRLFATSKLPGRLMGGRAVRTRMARFTGWGNLQTLATGHLMVGIAVEQGDAQAAGKRFTLRDLFPVESVQSLRSVIVSSCGIQSGGKNKTVPCSGSVVRA